MVKIRPEPDLFRIKIKLQKNLYIYIYIFITYNLTLTLTSLILTHSSFSLMPAAPLLHPHTLLPLVTLTLIPASPLPTTAPFVPTPHCLSPATSLPPCVSTGPPRSLSFSFSFSFLFFSGFISSQSCELFVFVILKGKIINLKFLCLCL